ncbi:MAG: hypothetical protein DI536_04645 [Archangium gephyra]|uniref:Uncharacterized protein n=1 Tax=Archangium gephyra TaxID=48 RepID=A0A2W5TU79_9BACT|nr:MAG: hypothetical protein DI536_04645 [Archangium gephyra]
MIKWKLMISTLPFVAIVTAIKALMEFVFHVKGVVDFGDVGIVLTAGVFLSGFVLAGTMADYKEAEKLPSEIAITLETIEEIFILACTGRPALAIGEFKRETLAVTDIIKAWLINAKKTPEVFQALTHMNVVIRKLEAGGAGPYASRAVPQLLMLRKNVSRIDVIRRTGFLPAAYALLEVLLAMILLLLLTASFKAVVAEFILVPVVALVNMYLLRLIKDVDDPFDYSSDGKKRGGAEVELFPIDEYRERLASRLDA